MADRTTATDEEQLLRSVALQNAQSILAGAPARRAGAAERQGGARESRRRSWPARWL